MKGCLNRPSRVRKYSRNWDEVEEGRELSRRPRGRKNSALAWARKLAVLISSYVSRGLIWKWGAGRWLPFTSLKLDGDADCSSNCIASSKCNRVRRNPVCGYGSEVDRIQLWARSAGFLEGIEEGELCWLVDAAILEQWSIGSDKSS